MAITDILASFTPAGSVALSFAVFTGRDGIPIDSPMQIEEMMTTPGVDYARWRDVHKQFRPKQYITWFECFSDADYQNTMRRYEDSITKFGTLMHKFRATVKTWKNVKCEGMIPMPPIPSGIFGFGSNNGPLTAAAIFTFRLTELSVAP